MDRHETSRPARRPAWLSLGAPLVVVVLLAPLASCASQKKAQAAGGPGGPGSQPPSGASSQWTPPNGAPPSDSMQPMGPPPPEGQGGPGGPDASSYRILAAYAQKGGSASRKGESLSAKAKDTSAVYLLDGARFSLSDCKVEKSGDTSSRDESDFHGLNAALLSSGGSSLGIEDTEIVTAGEGANAVFATGAGSTATLKGVRISTTANSSRGLDATMGGSISADEVDITTRGAHCGAIATDRGEGTIRVTGGTMTTYGEGSPGIYSTGDIGVSRAKLVAYGAEAAVIEGRNSITLKDCELEASKRCGVMLYQSFSGDAGVGTSSFSMEGGSLGAAEGPLFYVTNTDSVVRVKGAKLSAASGKLIVAGSDRWGQAGSNGGKLAFAAEAQELSGSVSADKASSVSLVLTKGSSLAGAITNASLALDADSTWTVTGNSRVAGLDLGLASGAGDADVSLALARISSAGFSVSYDASLPGNAWLGGVAWDLPGGGRLVPAK